MPLRPWRPIASVAPCRNCFACWAPPWPVSPRPQRRPRSSWASASATRQFVASATATGPKRTLDRSRFNRPVRSWAVATAPWFIHAKRAGKSCVPISSDTIQTACLSVPIRFKPARSCLSGTRQDLHPSFATGGPGEVVWVSAPPRRALGLSPLSGPGLSNLQRADGEFLQAIGPTPQRPRDALEPSQRHAHGDAGKPLDQPAVGPILETLGLIRHNPVVHPLLGAVPFFLDLLLRWIYNATNGSQVEFPVCRLTGGRA